MSDKMNGIAEISMNEMEKIAGGFESDRWRIYTVQKGDTLDRISSRLGVTVENLVIWNSIANPKLILVGQKLRYYGR